MIEISEISSNGPLSRSDEAYTGLKRMIFDSELLPGQWLRKRDLAARLKMSPTPLIEAFRRLEHEGLVTVVPQYGAKVRTWTVDEIAEGMELRAAMEAVVAARCADVAEPWQVAELRPIAEKIDQDDLITCDVHNPPPIQPGMGNTNDWRFHRALVELSGFQLIGREIERLQLLQMTCRLFAYPRKPSSVPHDAILDAIAAKNSEAAEKLMLQHIRHGRYVIPLLRERFGSGPVDFQPSRGPGE